MVDRKLRQKSESVTRCVNKSNISLNQNNFFGGLNAGIEDFTQRQRYPQNSQHMAVTIEVEAKKFKDKLHAED